MAGDLESKILAGDLSLSASTLQTHPEDQREAAPAMYRSSSNKTTSNTGPKGVLNDFHSSTAPPDPVSTLASRLRKSVGRFSGSDSEESEGEKEAQRRYRESRLRELQGSGERSARRQSYGHLREIGSAQFVNAVEGEPAAVTVVIHLYDHEIAACGAVNTHLSSLARQYRGTKFLRALAGELEFASGNEQDVLPTLLVYRGGQLVNQLVAFDSEWEGAASREAVEDALVRHGVIDRVDVDSGSESE